MPRGSEATRSTAARRALLTALAAGLLWMAPPPLTAARRVGPPSEQLREEQNAVVVARAVGPAGEGRYRFERRRVLHGEAPPLLELRMDEGSLGGLRPGRSYVVGFTSLVPVPRQRRVFAPDPCGPAVVQLDDVGAALFEDSRALRSLVAGPGPAAPARQVRALLRLAGRGEAASRRLALVELHLRDDLHSRLGDTEVRRLGALWSDLAGDPLGRHHLLELARLLAAGRTVPWLAGASRELLAAAPTELDLASPWPLLVQTAAGGLAAAGGPGDLPVLARHLVSNNPGVGKAALAAMESLDPGGAIRRAREALESSELHPETRRALEAFLGRVGTGGASEDVR